MNEVEIWKKVEEFFIKNFDMEANPPVEMLLYLIGIQELGSGWQEFSKDDKINLIHIAVCRLLEPFGYYKFTGYDEDGWPKYEILENLPELKADGWPQYDQLEDLPELKPNEQKILMKKAIVQYFIDENLLDEVS